MCVEADVLHSPVEAAGMEFVFAFRFPRIILKAIIQWLLSFSKVLPISVYGYWFSAILDYAS